jgi:MFS family permease
MAAGLIAGGRLTDTIGPRRIVLAGVLLSAGGLAAFATVDDHTSQLFLAIAGLMTGVDLGATTVPATTASYREVRPTAVPQATSTVRIFQQLGGSFGAAILAVLLQNDLTDEALTAGGQLTAAATATAFATTFGWAALIILAALIPAALLPDTPARQLNPAAPVEPGR